MPTRYGQSPWIDRFPKSRVPAHPRYRGATKTDVVVVGGGLTGCATAYAFAAAGREGHPARGRADRSGHDRLSKRLDFRRAGRAIRRSRKSDRRARRRPRLSDLAAGRARLRGAAAQAGREVRSATAPGAHGGADPGTDGPVETRAEDTPRRQPRRAPVVGPRRGGRHRARRRARVSARRTAPPSIRTARASASPRPRRRAGFNCSNDRPSSRSRSDARMPKCSRPAAGFASRASSSPPACRPTLFKSLARHFWFRTSYLALTAPVPAAMRKALGRRDAVVRDLADPPHTVRWVDDQRLLVAGADAAAVPPRLREKAKRSCSAPAS